MTNFTSPWSSGGVLDFYQDDSSIPQIPLRITGVSPHPKVTGLISQTYPFSLAGVSSQAIANVPFDLVIDLSIVGQSNETISQAKTTHIHPFSFKGESLSPKSSGAIVNDINVDRGIKSEVSIIAGNSSKLDNEFSSLFQGSPQLNREFIESFVVAQPLNTEWVDHQNDMPLLNNEVSIHQFDGEHVHKETANQNYLLEDGSMSFDVLCCDGDYLAYEMKAFNLDLDDLDVEKCSYWQRAETQEHEIDSSFSYGVALNKGWLDHFENAVNLTGEKPVIIIPPVVVPVTPPVLNFIDTWNGYGELDFLPIELDALIIMNEIDIYIVADGGNKTAIHPVNATLNFDRDSFVWNFNGQLFGANNLSLLRHRAKFEINVNGHQLLFTLREFSKANSFANEAYSFTCVTNSQWLGKPYASVHNGTLENPIGAWQLVADKFTTENFTLNRTQTPEWTLEKDSFSYLNKSAIEIAIQVAKASGAMLQPDKVNDIIHVQPRYKFSPWDWDTLTDEQCDHVINADYIDMQSSSDNTTPQLNSVLISGEMHGVITKVVKTGTAGDVRAKDVLSPLSQDHNVNSELARNIMADSGEQEVLGLALPLLPPGSAFGLMLPGEIIRVIYPEKTITGLCISNSVPIQSITDVTQSVSLELNNGYN